MKQGWEIKKLGEVCTFQRGLTYSKDDEVEHSNNCVLRSNNIDLDTMSIVLDELKYINDDFAVSEDKKVKPNTILICMSNGSKQHIGKVAFIDKEYGYAFGGFMGLIRPNAEVSPKFIYYSCISSSYKHFLAGIGNGANITNLKFSDLQQYTLPIPPREEQERIVEELNCLSGVIERKREQLRELDALAQSIFYQMFGDPITNEKGWEVKKVKDIFSVKIGPFGSLLHNSDYISGGTPLVNPIHMHNERICPDYDFSVSDNKLKELGNYILHTDDIVLARRGDIGRCAIVGMNEDGYLCGTGSLFIRPITNINSNFIIKQIRCNTMIEHLTSLAKGATMLNINCKIVEELIVILPPLTLQQEFAEKIEAIEKQKELIKKSISEVEDLFNSRMSYYFN